jgi:HSP20 family protein
MLIAPLFRRHPAANAHTWNAFHQLLSAADHHTLQSDDTAYTLSLDVPGVAKHQIAIDIEGQVVRITSLPEAPRHYQMSFELPQEIDPAQSSAQLEQGVLTLRLVKLVQARKVNTLTIN